MRDTTARDYAIDVNMDLFQDTIIPPPMDDNFQGPSQLLLEGPSIGEEAQQLLATTIEEERGHLIVLEQNKKERQNRLV